MVAVDLRLVYLIEVQETTTWTAVRSTHQIVAIIPINERRIII